MAVSALRKRHVDTTSVRCGEVLPLYTGGGRRMRDETIAVPWVRRALILAQLCGVLMSKSVVLPF